MEDLKAENEALKKRVSHLEQEITALNLHQQRVINEWIARGEELENRIKQLEVLIGLASTITRSPSVERVLKDAVDRTQQCLGVECVWAHLLKGDELHLVAQRGWTEAMIQEAGVLRLGQGVTGIAAQTGEPLIMDDITKDPRHKIVSTQMAGYRSLLGIPIKYEERIEEVLGIASRTPAKLGDIEKGVVQAIANLVAGALEHLRLDRDLEEKVFRLTAITQLTSIINRSLDIREVYEAFTEQLKTIAPVDRAVLSLIQGDKLITYCLYQAIGAPWKELEEIPLERTVAPLMIETRESRYIPDLALERGLAIEEELFKAGIRSHLSLPLISKGEVFAILCVGSCQPDAYPVGKREIFEEMARQISQGIYNQRLYRELKERQEELERAIREIGLSLVRAWESRYPDRRGHSERVSRYARKICEQMKLPEDRIGEIELAARLHDIGMVMMPDEIMFKKEVLTPAERAQIELHPTLGVDTLSPLPYFSGILPLIKYHHERYDGKGYPNGIKGETIPLGSRIISVADSYDAMTSPRLYRPPLSQAEVIEELKKGKAKQWDPEIVEAFLEVLSE